MSTSSSPALKSVKWIRFKCISEIGWSDTPGLRKSLEGVSDQYLIDPVYPQSSREGSCSLVTFEDDSGVHSFLFDFGFGVEFMRQRLAGENIGALDFAVLSHEHFDHFWACDVVLSQRDRSFRVFVPTLTDKGMARLAKAAPVSVPLGGFLEPDHHAVHIAQLKTPPGAPLFGIQNENIAIMRVAGCGLVVITGCSHPTIKSVIDYVLTTFPGEEIHTIYGGLHLDPFNEWNAKTEGGLKAAEDSLRHVKHIACMHCTGKRGAIELRARKFDVIRGSGGDGEHIGSGDVFTVPLQKK